MTSTIYLDSSALLKRLFDEPESELFATALDEVHGRGDRVVTSALSRVEVTRAARARLDAGPARLLTIGASEAFIGVGIAPLSRSVLESARIIGPPVLRSLDAIHLATAVASGADQVWTYDRRMAVVAEELGIPTRSPS